MHQNTHRGGTGCASSRAAHETNFSVLTHRPRNLQPTRNLSSQVGLASCLPRIPSTSTPQTGQPAPLTARPAFTHHRETVRRPPTPRGKKNERTTCVCVRASCHSGLAHARDSSSRHLQRGISAAQRSTLRWVLKVLRAAPRVAPPGSVETSGGPRRPRAAANQPIARALGDGLACSQYRLGE